MITIRFLALIGFSACLIGGCTTEENIDPGATAETYSLTEALRIGDEAAMDTVYFDSIDDIEVDAQGNVLVTDDASAGFRIFSADGTLTHEIGSEGEAPGEFQYPPLLTVGAKDSVFAFDGDNGRLTVYSPGDFQLTRMVNLTTHVPDHISAYDVLATLPEGLLVEFDYFTDEVTSDENDWPVEIKFLNHSGRVLRDSIVLIPSYQLTLISGRLLYPRLWGRESFIISSSDGLIHAGWNETIQVRTTSLNGVVGEFVIPHSPIPLTLNEINERISRYPTEWQDQFRRDMPDTKPAFNAMVLDDEDRLWMQLSWPADSAKADWLVVESSTGDVVAKTSLPVTATIMKIRQRKAYGVVDEGTDVVTVWEISSSHSQRR